MRRFFLTFLFLFTLAVIWIALHVTYITRDGFKDDIRPVDFAVILGTSVLRSGKPGTYLRKRLDKATELYQEGFFKNIVVSGAVSAGYNEPNAMKNYLVRKGVDSNAIIEDFEGNDTLASALNASKIAQEQGWSSAMIITQYFHITRTKLAFYRAGFPSTATAHADFWRYSPRLLLRETLAFYYYLVRPLTQRERTDFSRKN